MNKKIYMPVRINESDVSSINETPIKDLFTFEQ